MYLFSGPPVGGTSTRKTQLLISLRCHARCAGMLTFRNIILVVILFPGGGGRGSFQSVKSGYTNYSSANQLPGFQVGQKILTVL